MIPKSTREKIEEAMRRFDRELRDTPEWHGWEENEAQKYAIAFEGLRYPVKKVVSLVTGADVGSFSGGNEANSYVSKLGFDVVSIRRERQVWWVNQGFTYEQEKAGGYLWAPLKDKAGNTQVHWETMSEVSTGDVVIHYCEGQIRALSYVEAAAIDSLKPAELKGSEWDKQGRLVKAAYFVLSPPIELVTIAGRLLALEIPQGPLTQNGTVKQGYLWRFSPEGLALLRQQSPSSWPTWGNSTVSNGTPATPVTQLFEELKTQGLHFASELIANYLLALATKRFVILSGLSGAGKTQLAIAIAKHYQPTMACPPIPAVYK